ncbi:MAG: carbohydrate binding family 9 domain-containing protein, partial [Candidatus Latescibacteria bacterium]|nr:carbohydrate binding family 9 domain-containing protein [Candidatus Latescibacterota bacterium]
RKAAALFGIGPEFEKEVLATNGHDTPEIVSVATPAPSVRVAPPLIRVAAAADAWFDPADTPYVGTSVEPEIIDTRNINYDDYFLNAVRVKSGPEMDGLLNDEQWRLAPAAAGFRQLWPAEGYLDTERTEVRVLYDDNTIYFGIMCYDSEPDRIVATEMRRDQNVDADDNFEMTIAPYGDQGDSYYFITNPLGSRRDALIGSGFSSFSPDWNANWQCYGKRHEMGWSLEIAIPFRNFRFNPNDKQEWAVNFGRHVKRTRGAAFWVPISRADGGLASFYKYEKGGRIVGLNNIDPGRSVEVLPYSVMGTLGARDVSGGKENIGYNFKRDFGGDIKWAITSGVTADATINPDFAQVSADDQIVNLTRFEFGFQEKRPFFLEGVGIFSFGGFFTQPNIFFSRRIGSQLFDGTNVRILHGEKVSGKIGKTNFGILNVRTEETPWAFTSTSVQTLTDTTTASDGSLAFTNRDTLTVARFPQIEPETSWHAFRLKQNLFSRSTIGLMATLKEPEDRPDNKIDFPGLSLSKSNYNRVIGLDAQLQFARSQHQMGFILARSFVPGPKLQSNILAVGDSTLLKQRAVSFAGTVSQGWGNSWLNTNASYSDIRAGFTADMGFIPRRDIRQANASFGITRLLRRWGIRSVGSRGFGGFGGGLVSGGWITRHKGNFFDPDLVESWDFSVSPGMELENGTRLGI